MHKGFLLLLKAISFSGKHMLVKAVCFLEYFSPEIAIAEEYSET